MQLPFMRSDPLGLPLCMRSVDYSLLPVGAMAGRTLPGGRTYTQAVGTNQTEEVFVTSWASGTMSRISAVANTPKVGMAPNGKRGLRLRASWKNYLRNSNAFGSWTVTGTSVVASNVAVSPDGATNADTLTDNDAAAYELVNATFDAIPTDTETYRFEGYVKATAGETHAAAINWGLTGGTPITDSLRLNTENGTATLLGLTTTPMQAFGSWYRWKDTIAGNGTNTGSGLALYPSATTIPLPGADTFAGQGVKTVYEFSVTRGKLWREPQPTGASGATCADCALTAPASWYVRGGRVRLRIKWSPTGAPTDYNTSFRLFDHGGETTYVEFSATDQKLRIVVAGGAAEVCAVPLWWPVASLLTTTHPMVEFDIEFGGNVASRIRYRYSTDGGVTWTLPFDPMGGTTGVAQGNVTASGNVGIMTGASAGTVADGWLHEEELISYAPAWSLQALPTDVASVKAFFRADSSYTLAGSLVSAWAGQTATAVTPFTQGVTANQPTINATGFGTARPSFTYDGANDYLEAGPLSEWLTRGAVYVLFKCAVVSTNNSPNYNNRPLWQNIGAYAGVGLRNGPIAGAFNYDGNYDDASVAFALSTSQVLRWRHNLTNLYVRVTGGAESAATPSGATQVLTGNNRIGGNPGAVGVYYQGEIAAVVAMNTDPTDPEDTSIMDFLNRYGGLA